MATIGTFTRSNETGSFTGAVKTLSINVKTTIKPAIRTRTDLTARDVRRLELHGYKVLVIPTDHQTKTDQNIVVSARYVYSHQADRRRPTGIMRCRRGRRPYHLPVELCSENRPTTDRSATRSA